jgi:16S rRNA U1498 N3-methylase RsmE
MLRQRSKNTKPKRGPTKYKGIIRDATELGVTRVHLWRVLEGERESDPLMRRYADLKSQQLKKAA